jgi:hypothetical protein
MSPIARPRSKTSVIRVRGAGASLKSNRRIAAA